MGGLRARCTLALVGASGPSAGRAAGPAPGRLVAAGLLAACALTLVPPAGSADHLSYLAYGRIAAAGEDAYLVAPGDWRGGADPVAGAVQPPWRDTPSVYGPLATGAFAVAALLGGGSLRGTVWAWSLICAAAFAAVALALDRAHRGDDAARRRAALLWTVNPLLLGQLVLGAHVDVLAAALAIAALTLAARHGLLAGLLIGAAASIKAPYAVFGLAAAWGLLTADPTRGASRDDAAGVRARPGALLSGLAGALLVAVPAHLLAGPHVFDQLGRASGFTSIASPWRGLVNLVELGTGTGSLRPLVVPAALLVAAVVAVVLARRVLGAPGSGGPGGADLGADAAIARAALVAGAAWVLCAPYTLPWYDAMVWAPLALVAVRPGELAMLENLLLARLLVLTVAYLPGRVVGLTPLLEDLTLGVRRYLAPPLVLLCLIAVVVWSLRAPSGRTPTAAAAG